MPSYMRLNSVERARRYEYIFCLFDYRRAPGRAGIPGVGHHVPTALLASPDVMPLEGVVSPEDVYARDIRWITECDMLLAEVSTPSHGVGYEIGYALSLGKKVLCLYRKGRKVSKMILGNPHSKLTIHPYETPEQAVQLLSNYLSQITRIKAR